MKLLMKLSNELNIIDEIVVGSARLLGIVDGGNEDDDFGDGVGVGVGVEVDLLLLEVGVGVAVLVTLFGGFSSILTEEILRG